MINAPIYVIYPLMGRILTANVIISVKCAKMVDFLEFRFSMQGKQKNLTIVTVPTNTYI